MLQKVKNSIVGFFVAVVAFVAIAVFWHLHSPCSVGWVKKEKGPLKKRPL
jgi:hypothetical protein